MNEIINKISRKHFDTEPDSIEQILNKGKVNQVFKVLVDGTPYIFRINKKDYLNTYQKEFFCIKKATEAKIPTSEAYFVGVEDENSYMILDYIEGINGSDLPEEKHNDVYRQLGEYASKFNKISLDGFGRDMEDENRGFTKDWDTFYKETMGNIFESSILIDKGVLTKEQSNSIKERLSEMEKWNVSPRLCHGNLHITNTIITPEDKVFVIDWGNGAGNLAPHDDLADLIAWKDRKYLSCFLEGYGMNKEEFNEIEHDVHNLLIIQLLNVIKYAFEINKKFLDKDFISSSIKRIMELK